jgi:cell division septation protein DedD
MRWMKVAAVAIGALIVFMIVGTVVHLLMDVVFAAIVIAAIAVAVKVAAGRRKLPSARRDSYEEIREPKRAAPTVNVPPPAHTGVNVDDDLARLKREMGGN